jgi:excisionase family DNA binding protein
MNSQQNNFSPRLAYSPEEAAELVGAHRNTVYRLIRAGKLKAVRFGRKWVVPVESLNAYLSGGH